MFKIIRDLFRYNEEFAVGAILTIFVVVMAALLVLFAISAEPNLRGAP